MSWLRLFSSEDDEEMVSSSSLYEVKQERNKRVVDAFLPLGVYVEEDWAGEILVNGITGLSQEASVQVYMAEYIQKLEKRIKELEGEE